MKRLLRISCLMVFGVVTGVAQTAWQPGKNLVPLRGQIQHIYFLPHALGNATTPARKILFAPGDGGWRGFAIQIASGLAAQGNDVYALDTKHYLASFTHGPQHLTTLAVMRDFHELAARMQAQPNETISLVGWSTGGGLVVLAGANGDKALYNGLIAISLGKTNLLGWRCWDNLTYLTGKLPHEPTYPTETYLRQTAPLPVFIIQSSHDQFIPNKDAEELFVQLKPPKRFRLIHAHDHSFNGARPEFFATLQRGLAWLAQHEQRRAASHASASHPETQDLSAVPN